MTLPIDRTTLTLAQGNQVPSAVASSAKNVNALAVLFNTIDELNAKLDTHTAAATLAHPDSSVTTAKIANLAVATAKIADLAVTTGKIAELGVTTAKLNDLAVTLAKMATNSVGTTQIIDLAVTRAKIALQSIGSAQLDPTLLTDFGDIAIQAEFDRRGINVMKYGAVGNGVTDDTAAFQAAVNAANSAGGGTVSLPYTSTGYKINGTVTLYSKIIVQGNNSKIISPSTAGATNIFAGSGLTDVSIYDLYFQSTNDRVSFDGRTGLSSNRLGINLSNTTSIRLINIKGSGLEYLIKIDTATNSNVTLDDIYATDVRQPVFISNSRNVRGKNWHLVCPALANTDSLNHQIYISDNVVDLQVDQVYLEGGAGYALQMQGASVLTESINFSNVKMYNTDAGVVFSGLVKNSRVRSVEFDTTRTNVVVFLGTGGDDNIVDGFNVINPTQATSLELISVIATTGKYEMRNGKISNTKNRIVNMASTNQFMFDSITFIDCASTTTTNLIFSNSGVGHLKFVMKNCYWYDSAIPTADIFSMRGTVFSDISNNEFISDVSTAKNVGFNTTIGTHFVRNNLFMNWANIVHPTADTQSYGSNNMNALLPVGTKTGSGTPESAVVAPVGYTYQRSNGGAVTTLYVKESGTGNTGWVAK